MKLSFEDFIADLTLLDIQKAEDNLYRKMRKIQKRHINLQVKEYLTMTRQNNRHKDEQQFRNHLSFHSFYACKRAYQS